MWTRILPHPVDPGIPRYATPQSIRSIASFALVVGVFSTLFQVLLLRFAIPLEQIMEGPDGTHEFADLSHSAYITSVGYAALDRAIPSSAVVQYSPNFPNFFWPGGGLDWIKHQAAI